MRERSANASRSRRGRGAGGGGGQRGGARVRRRSSSRGGPSGFRRGGAPFLDQDDDHATIQTPREPRARTKAYPGDFLREPDGPREPSRVVVSWEPRNGGAPPRPA